MLGVLARGQERGLLCISWDTGFAFPQMLVAGPWEREEERERKSVMIAVSVFTGRWLCSIKSKSAAEWNKMCQNMSLCTLFTDAHPLVFLCFPHLAVCDSAAAGFGPVCLNLVSQSRQCHWKSDNISAPSRRNLVSPYCGIEFIFFRNQYNWSPFR